MPIHLTTFVKGSLLWGLLLSGLAPVAIAEAGECASQKEYAVVLHGGAFITQRPSPEAIAFLRRLIDQSAARLAENQPALEVVTFAVASMEDSSLFNAGRGAFTNSAGAVEMDAAIMLGSTLQAGAIASMSRIENPILAARLVLEKTPHVLLVGPAGEGTLENLGLRMRKSVSLGHEQTNRVAVAGTSDEPTMSRPQAKLGTVGAVALDRCGIIAAATSTGGTAAKLPGRVGDTPIPGAGVYAGELVGLSSTGIGEFFVRRVAAHEVAARVRHARMPLAQAMHGVLEDDLKPMGGFGAMIGIDRLGTIHVETNTTGVTFAVASSAIAPIAGQDPRSVRFQQNEE